MRELKGFRWFFSKTIAARLGTIRSWRRRAFVRASAWDFVVWSDFVTGVFPLGRGTSEAAARAGNVTVVLASASTTKRRAARGKELMSAEFHRPTAAPPRIEGPRTD